MCVGWGYGVRTPTEGAATANVNADVHSKKRHKRCGKKMKSRRWNPQSVEASGLWSQGKGGKEGKGVWESSAKRQEGAGPGSEKVGDRGGSNARKPTRETPSELGRNESRSGQYTKNARTPE